MSKNRDVIELDEMSFNLLEARGRSGSFSGSFKKGAGVTVRCGERECSAVVDRAGKHSFVAKTKKQSQNVD